MGDVVPITSCGAMPRPADYDPLDTLAEWVEHARAARMRQPMTAILVVEDGDGGLWWACDSRLERCDLARITGLLTMAQHHTRSDTNRIMDLDLPEDPTP